MAQEQIQEQRLTQQQKLQQSVTQQQLLQAQLTELPITQLIERINTEMDDNPALEVSADDYQEDYHEPGDSDAGDAGDSESDYERASRPWTMPWHR